MKKVLEKILFFSPFISFFVYTIMVAYAFVYSRVPNKSDALLFGKVETFLEQREVAFLSSIKICENLNFSTAHPEKFKF